MRKAIVMAGGLGLALFAFGADVVPTAFVSEMGRTISVSGETVTLDVAYCFDAWEGGVLPSAADREATYAQWGAYTNWNADFVVTFDRAVAAKSIAMYGQTEAFGADWVPMSIDNDLAAGVPYMILRDNLGQSIPYVAIAEMIVRFVCGVKNLSPANAGTTMTIELRLSDPNSSTTKTLVTRSLRFASVTTPNWFDARIGTYASWPADATNVVGGIWQAGDEALEDVAAVKSAGVLSVDATALDFVATRPRTLGANADRMTVTSDIDFGVNERESLPKVAPEWKGGVVRVQEAESEAYYGLARDGTSNVWRRLEGPAPTGGTVRFEMTVRRKEGQSVVSYSINGAAYRLNGEKRIPVVVTEAVKGVSLGGAGTLTSLAASAESATLIHIR